MVEGNEPQEGSHSAKGELGKAASCQDCFKAGAASRPFWTVELVGVKEDC